VASAIIDAWVACYGPPDRILSDQGPQFMSNFFIAVMKVLSTETVCTTAYHPQTNGQVERYNRTTTSLRLHSSPFATMEKNIYRFLSSSRVTSRSVKGGAYNIREHIHRNNSDLRFLAITTSYSRVAENNPNKIFFIAFAPARTFASCCKYYFLAHDSGPIY